MVARLGSCRSDLGGGSWHRCRCSPFKEAEGLFDAAIDLRIADRDTPALGLLCDQDFLDEQFQLGAAENLGVGQLLLHTEELILVVPQHLGVVADQGHELLQVGDLVDQIPLAEPHPGLQLFGHDLLSGHDSHRLLRQHDPGLIPAVADQSNHQHAHHDRTGQDTIAKRSLPLGTCDVLSSDPHRGFLGGHTIQALGADDPRGK